VSGERQRVRDLLYRSACALNIDHAELNSVSRRRRFLDGHRNRCAGQLYGTYWTRRGVRRELNTDACDLNKCACERNDRACDLNACAFTLSRVAPCRDDLHITLAR
jgi:hypothetical protein